MRAVDVALGAVTAAAVVVGTAVLGQAVTAGGTVPLATTLGLAVLFRRRWPVPVLVASVLALVGFAGSELGTPGVVWPATVAYGTVVVAGELRWAVGIGVVNLGAASAFVPVGPQLGGETLWLVAVVAAAQAYVGWGRRRAAEERLLMARELHDIVAHTLAVVGIQLNVVEDALDSADVDEARSALALAQSVRGTAMTDLRSLVGVLRDDPPDLASLAAGVGLPVAVHGSLAGLPAPVALAVYRVVQEGLTNVVKHADARTATVTVRRSDGAVAVSVVDDGAGVAGSGGHGIEGMRERVTALGGVLSAGPGAVGWELSARIPLR